MICPGWGKWDAHMKKNGSIKDLSVYIVGVGGAGSNSINRLKGMGVHDAETIAVNTDRAHLIQITADKRMLIGGNYTAGLGAGGDPNIGQDCAEHAWKQFCNFFKDANLVFVIAGLGGGTGTGAAPVIVENARRQGAMVVAIVTMPFSSELKTKRRLALSGLKKIECYANSTIVLENDRLLNVAPNMSVNQAFAMMDSLTSNIVKSVTETVTCNSLMNLDFNDLRTVLETGGVSTIITGESRIDEPEKAVHDATSNPFLDVNLTGARSALIHLTGGEDMSILKLNQVLNMMTSELDPEANVILGARVHPSYNHRIKLLSIVTGLGKNRITS